MKIKFAETAERKAPQKRFSITEELREGDENLQILAAVVTVFSIFGFCLCTYFGW